MNTSFRPDPNPAQYRDGRPAAPWRIEAQDAGVVLRHGSGPLDCDRFGARDIWVVEHGGTYFMTYDGAGPRGWLACLATSTNLVDWQCHGPMMDLGSPGEPDSATVSYATLLFHENTWHSHYLGSPNCSPPPNRVPMFPYQTLRATAPSPYGPWRKRRDLHGLSVKPDSFYEDCASPGQIFRHKDRLWQIFSASCGKGKHPVLRGLGIASCDSLDDPWTIAERPLVDVSEQVENSSLYYQESDGTWFLFTNHIGLASPDEALHEAEAGDEFTDAVWVYWSRDPLLWNPAHKAVVLDGRNCSWASRCVGLPSVVKMDNRLALFYDSPGGASLSHVGRDIGLAWLDLPIVAPPSAV